MVKFPVKFHVTILRHLLIILLLLTLGCQHQSEKQEAPALKPVARFTIIDGEATDNKTGLTWQRCSVGKYWEGKSQRCLGYIKLMTYEEAQQQENSEWRVPTSDELLALRDETRRSQIQVPFIDIRTFSDIDPGNWCYWSSTPGRNNVAGAWIVNFNDRGYSAYGDKDRNLAGAVRLVRRSISRPDLAHIVPAGRSSPAIGIDKANARFVIHGEEVYDTITDLIWQRCSVGRRWVVEESRCIGSVNVMTFRLAQRQGFASWRVPTQDELATLLDEERIRRRKEPTINLIVFDLDVEYWSYWSSNLAPDLGSPGVKFGRSVTFKRGGITANMLVENLAVRLVRSRVQTEDAWAISSFSPPTSNASILSSADAGISNLRYSIRGNEVGDKLTNLTWQRCSVGRRWTDKKRGCIGVIKFFTFDDVQRQGHDIWRVPSKEELSTLIDQERKAQHKASTIDSVAFPDLDVDKWWYWSATPNKDTAWSVFFGQGADPDFDGVYGFNTRSSLQPLRLVRSGL